MKPTRIQRRRTKGFRLQDQSPDGRLVVYVGRPTKWGNPVILGDATFKVLMHHRLLMASTFSAAIERARIRNELAGKHLACWCPLGQPCHADTLLKIANEGDGDEP